MLSRVSKIVRWNSKTGRQSIHSNKAPLGLDCRQLASLSTAVKKSYHDTISNLKIGSHTRVLFQGFTGRQATQNAKQSLDYGTNIVGGVTPGTRREHLGLPVLPTMRAAKDQLNPDATAVYVAAAQAAGAIEEALEAEIPLIVVVAEHIPLHDLLSIHSMLRSQCKSRLVGANCPGIISPIGRCRIGFQPLSCFSAGSVGIVARSGTLSYETVASTTRAGVGQSLVIGMGGDVLTGTNFVDALEVFENDEATKGIILVGEIGGHAEEEAAAWIKEYRRRTSNPKPIMALVAGIQAAPGRMMGHSGAFVAQGEGDATSKIRALEDAGVVMTGHPERFGSSMKQLLTSYGQHGSLRTCDGLQKRSLHTYSRRPKTTSLHLWRKPVERSLHIGESQAFELLREQGPLHVSGRKDTGGEQLLFALTVDRSKHAPCLILGRYKDNEDPWPSSKKFFFDAGRTDQFDYRALGTTLDVKGASSSVFSRIIEVLMQIFREKEASMLELRLSQDNNRNWVISEAHFEFDDAAFKVAKRQEDIHSMRDLQAEVPEEVEAEKDGIVYVKLQGDGKIGTLVNGAGLAMNTNDALHSLGGKCANFLDTGGKATAETVKSSFRLILQDPRVKTIFVNIFGGLTLCDMIAEGIILAYKDLKIELPVVVRLRGTNEDIGQKLIAESGLPLHAFDGFEEAARKVIEFAEAAG